MGGGDKHARLIARSAGGDGSIALPARLFVGRECDGVAPGQRLVLDDPEISRQHLEIRFDAVGKSAFLVDTSTNGTWLNGARVERGAPVPLQHADRIRLGGSELELDAELALEQQGPSGRSTARPIRTAAAAVAVGDVIGYSALTEAVGSEAVSDALATLFTHLRELLRDWGGGVGNYAGDALFALWEFEHQADAAERALGYALSARELVERIGADLPPLERPVRMGWGVAAGEVSTASIAGLSSAVLGDAPNLAFRLSSLAGRDRRASVLATHGVVEASGLGVGSESAREVLMVKGRSTPELVIEVRAGAPPRPEAGSRR